MYGEYYTEMSRRDNTLLTVDFNLRLRQAAHNCYFQKVP